MNKVVNNGLYLAAGLAIGSVATYFLGVRRIEKQVNIEFDKIKEEWIEEQERMQTEDLYFVNLDEGAPDPAEPEQPSIDPKKVEKMANKLSNLVVKNRDKKPITEYSKMYGPKHEDDVISIEEYMDKTDIITSVPKNHSDLITSEQFTDDEEYNKQHYILYADGILADDEDDSMVEYEGENAENPLDPDVIYGFLIDDELDELYIRNEGLKRDYEIIKSARLYNE